MPQVCDGKKTKQLRHQNHHGIKPDDGTLIDSMSQIW